MSTPFKTVAAPGMSADEGQNTNAAHPTDGISPFGPLTDAHGAPVTPPMPEVHVMVVEDNALSRRMLNVFLRRKGFYVHSFGNSTEALGWVAFESPAAIVLDVLLPDISGLDLYEKLRSMPHLAQVPVLFVTAFGGERYERECMQRGAVGFFAKPAYLPSIASCILRSVQHS